MLCTLGDTQGIYNANAAYCKFTTFHMLFFMPDVKVSEEIETSTPSSIEGKKTKGFLFTVTIIHLLEQEMMLQQYTKNLPSNLLDEENVFQNKFQ